MRRFIFFLLPSLLVLAGCGGSASVRTVATATVVIATPTIESTAQNAPAPSVTPTPRSPQIQHVFYIMMENHGTSQILGNSADAPYLNQLAKNYGVARQYYGVTHPSLPNYLAAISGDFQGIWDDCSAGASVYCAPQEFSSVLTRSEYNNAGSRSHLFSGQTLIDQLEARHMTWRAYMQSVPAVGYTGVSTALYAERHNPFVYFASIRNNPARLQQILPFTRFGQDIKASSVPNFVWITPDVCSDMHGVSLVDALALGIPNCASYDGIIARGDAFIAQVVPQIMSSPAWKEGAAIVIAWDENDSGSSGCCHGPTGVNGAPLGGGDVPLIVVTSRGPRPMVLDSGPYNHYSLLATIEHLWGLGCLANTCMGDAQLLTKLFE